MWRHRCGYQLWAVVLDRLGAHVVVNFRDGSCDGMVVFLCPGCGGELQLWWKDAEWRGEPWPNAGGMWDGEVWVCGDGRRV